MTEKYFDFWTNDAANYAADSSFDYLGTAVYYKIYNNYSTMTSAASAITALNSSTTYSAAADKMIETYGYRELITTTTSQSPLIPASASNQRVYIRLSDYQSDTSFRGKTGHRIQRRHQHCGDNRRSAQKCFRKIHVQLRTDDKRFYLQQGSCKRGFGLQLYIKRIFYRL
jgi:hypothetical protein